MTEIKICPICKKPNRRGIMNVANVVRKLLEENLKKT